MNRPQPSADNVAFVSQALIKAAQRLQNSGQMHFDKATNSNIAVIVEPREHPLLINIIRTVMALLDDTWNLAVVHGTDNKTFIQEGLLGWNFIMIDLGVKNLSADEHNKLLRTRQFWKSFRQENVLIFQTDACLLNRGIQKYIGHHFIGAETLNPHELTPGKCGMNGGLSLRKKSSMLECIDKISVQDINDWRKKSGCNELPSWTYFKKIAEDVYFWHALEMLSKPLPNKATAGAFSTEAVFRLDSLGIHGFNKVFFERSLLESMFKNSDLYSL